MRKRAWCFLLILLVSDALLFSQDRPDLNLLKERVKIFWELVREGRKREALEIVDPPTQDIFLSRRELSFSSFLVRHIYFEDDPTRVAVTIGAQVLPPGFRHPVEWPVEESWIYRDGNWYVHCEASRVKEFFGARMDEELFALSVHPARVVLDESSSRDILIRNNTLKEIEVRDMIPSADFILAEWAGQESRKIAPGMRGTVRIRWNTARVPADWTGGYVDIEVTGPLVIRLPIQRP